MAPRSSVEDLALSGLSSKQFLNAHYSLTEAVRGPENFLEELFGDQGETLMGYLLRDLGLDLEEEDELSEAGASVVAFLSTAIVHMVGRSFESHPDMEEAEYVASLVKLIPTLGLPLAEVLEPDLQEMLDLLTGEPLALPRGLMVGQLLALAAEEDQAYMPQELTTLDAALDVLMAIQDSM